MITERDVLVQKEYRKVRLEEADLQRLIRQAYQHETTLLRPLLARLGGQLVEWGCRLQAQYGTLAEASNSIRHIKTLRQQLSA